MYALIYNKSDDIFIAFNNYLMDDSLNLSGDKEIVLAQIDRLHEEHRLKNCESLSMSIIEIQCVAWRHVSSTMKRHRTKL